MRLQPSVWATVLCRLLLLQVLSQPSVPYSEKISASPGLYLIKEQIPGDSVCCSWSHSSPASITQQPPHMWYMYSMLGSLLHYSPSEEGVPQQGCLDPEEYRNQWADSPSSHVQPSHYSPPIGCSILWSMSSRFSWNLKLCCWIHFIISNPFFSRIIYFGGPYDPSL